MAKPSRSPLSAPMRPTSTGGVPQRCVSARSRRTRAGVIRAIGNAAERFEEDHLRVLRAVRFATRLNFEIEPATWAAMRRAAPKVANIAAERVGEEVVRSEERR